MSQGVAAGLDSPPRIDGSVPIVVVDHRGPCRDGVLERA